MKKLIFVNVFFLFVAQLCNAQLLSTQVVTDDMTLREARYALLVELATINYYFFEDHHKPKSDTKDKWSTPVFRLPGDEPFVLYDCDTIINRLKTSKWEAEFAHTPSTKNANIFYGYEYDKYPLLNKSEDYLRSPIFRTKPCVVYYANGEIVSDENILSKKKWHETRKTIDSILVDTRVLYPIATKTVNVPMMESDKIEVKTGGHIRFVGFRGRYFEVEITDNLNNHITKIQCLNKDGIRINASTNNITYLPSDSMYSHASECYSIYSKLIDNIDNKEYKSINELKTSYELLRIPQPIVKEISFQEYLMPKDATAVEFTYYSKYDSLQIGKLMSHKRHPRKSDYVVMTDRKDKKTVYGIADLDGNWVIKPQFLWWDNEVGLLFTGKVDSYTEEQLYRLDVETKSMIPVGYEIEKNIDDTLLITNLDDKMGVVDRNGKLILSNKFKNVSYDKEFKIFIVRLDSNMHQYQIYNRAGELVLPDTYRNNIKIDSSFKKSKL